ncbi:MAG: PAS domain S-box protein [Candidatus Aminicenantes bacterium]|nr:PAS domain S-box protein [Candidatus Aminicenantes bacterium]NIM83976.1 PAS domain S-box protein [Candidatus Aminicenantes bacterium]NIN23450.1 PAS domain S-box protein [Candidatus Aminicenantes bacterium]NIN47155.1 PAS domain S-box protein [Candidatus Aminicenantes bacterium]NIN90079.1 PAS domain S-box protein [Candidatus Aminicenantes bacterium]
MSVFAVIPLLTAVASLFLGDFVFYLNPRLVVNRMFFYCCLLFTFLGFVEFAFCRAETYDTAFFWFKMGAVWTFMVSVGIHFVLIFIEKKKLLKKWQIFSLVYLPALFFFALEVVGGPPVELIKLSWGWTYTYQVETIVYNLEIFWVIGASIFAFYLVIRYYLKSTDKVKKVQARLLITGFSFPSILVLVSWIILPYLEIPAPDLTSTGFFITMVFVGFGIWKYKLFTLTLEVAAETILSTMADALFLVSLAGEIVSTNKAACQLLGYQESELIGQDIDVIFTPGEKIKIKEIQMEQLMTTASITDIETQVKTKENSIIPISLSGSLVQDKQGTKQGIIYVGRDISERKKVEKIMKDSLREKEVLITEIHHRVKNNLQIISSLLELQSDTQEDPRILNIFQESKDRIRAMSLVHENLYQFGDLARIDGIEYIHSLVDYLFNTYGELAENVTPSIQIETPSLQLVMNTAIPIGLILTELLSNALKHAFPSGKKGEIHIVIRDAPNGMLTLEVRDNGVGLPADLDIQEAKSLGLELITLLTQQVKGTLEVEGKKGTTVSLTFPFPKGVA